MIPQVASQPQEHHRHYPQLRPPLQNPSQQQSHTFPGPYHIQSHPSGIADAAAFGLNSTAARPAEIPNHPHNETHDALHTAQHLSAMLQVPSEHRLSFQAVSGALTPQPTPSRQQLMASEHILRRKTPNGTLAAGYNGSPTEWTSASSTPRQSDPSSSSHLLSQQSPHPYGSDYARPVLIRQPSGSSTPWHPPPTEPAHDRPDLSWSRGVGGEVNGGGRTYASQYPPDMDSVLHQGSVQQPSTYFSPNGARIPTVLQPTYQPCMGPTASNEGGPYGPYWPDGAFIPYRPAAVRDPRYYIPNVSVPWSHGPGHGQHGPQGSAWQYVGGFSGQAANRRDAHAYQTAHSPMRHHGAFTPNGLPADHASPHSGHSARMGPINNTPNGAHYSHHSRCREGPQSHPVPFLAASPHQDMHARYSSEPGATWASSSRSMGGDLMPTNAHGPRAGTAQFKDKALSWAHSVYVDLLAALHQSRRNTHQTHLANGHQQGSPASIYPRPPRQPGSNFSTPQRQESPPAGESVPPYHSHEAHSDHHASKKVKQGQGADSSSRRARTDSGTAHHHAARHGSHRVDSDPTQEVVVDSPSSVGHSRPSHASFNISEKVNTLRRSSGSPISPIYAQFADSPSSPLTNALAALEMITRLCRESSWQWVDGMLLAGCLAYGLGDYGKALRWYKKILDIDPNHVEAISNLAATLLSLNRREEAEQYWLRSVKLRPSYFEAVEHLIGLLCGNQRGKEAVDIIEYVERSLRYVRPGDAFKGTEQHSETESETSRASSVTPSECSERVTFEYDMDDVATVMRDVGDTAAASQPGYGSSGFAIPGSENGRILALVHAKGNMLYALGDNAAAARAFEDAVLIGAGRRRDGIQGLIQQISKVMSSEVANTTTTATGRGKGGSPEPILLLPDKALQTAKLVFPSHGELPGLRHVPNGMAKKAAISTTSNSLLSLAKIFQDGMSSGNTAGLKATSGVRDILALYYLSLALQPSPSTANNVGILLASVQQQSVAPKTSVVTSASTSTAQLPPIPGVVPGSGIALALAYYNYGLNLDSKHAHLYTNLGSLLKDVGQLSAAIKMYEQAVQCDGTFDIALANLANAVKDQGRIRDAISYYRRAVAASPDFAEAVCGLANALNSVCGWAGRGGVLLDHGNRDRWHVDEKGMLLDAKLTEAASRGWIKRVVEIVSKQLTDGENWGRGVLQAEVMNGIVRQLAATEAGEEWTGGKRQSIEQTLRSWAGRRWEGARVVRLVERATKRLVWRWYRARYVERLTVRASDYVRPQLPAALSVPAAPTVLPFHTFTCPLSAKQIRLISQRNGLRISCTTLRAPWLPTTVYAPPAPPSPHLNIGYVSSDFNNHPLAHLMQSVFGLHDGSVAKAFCYATTTSDNSVHRQQIEREAPVFYDASSWSAERLVQQVLADGIHILVNLNGYTRGARNDVFAARPAPIQMSFMGFAGTLGAEWCDYLLADRTAVPPETLRPWRRNVDLMDQLRDESCGDEEDWVYSENIIFAEDTFFCCDHRQSAPDAREKQLSWGEEQVRRWRMRKELFPRLKDDVVILGNFNQLYKIEPTTFRSWLRVLARIPNAVLWLLRFPDLGEANLKHTAKLWAGQEVASRILFTDVAPKHQHISRARVCDLFLDTPECNAHTTAADVLWSGTPLLTFPRYPYKMCSRMAASILIGALPKSEEGSQAAAELIVKSEQEYEDRVVQLGGGLKYGADASRPERAAGRLSELRKLLYESRWTSALFDTRRWVRDLETAYKESWRKWVAGEGGDIWL